MKTPNGFLIFELKCAEQFCLHRVATRPSADDRIGMGEYDINLNSFAL